MRSRGFPKEPRKPDATRLSPNHACPKISSRRFARFSTARRSRRQPGRSAGAANMRKPSASPRRTQRGGAPVSVLRKRAAKKGSSAGAARAASGRNGGGARAAQAKAAPHVVARRTSERVLHTGGNAAAARPRRGQYLLCTIQAAEVVLVGALRNGPA